MIFELYLLPISMTQYFHLIFCFFLNIKILPMKIFNPILLKYVFYFEMM